MLHRPRAKVKEKRNELRLRMRKTMIMRDDRFPSKERSERRA